LFEFKIVNHSEVPFAHVTLEMDVERDPFAKQNQLCVKDSCWKELEDFNYLGHFNLHRDITV
jgi:hypothetical protein